jgi:hydroxyethylthiazole kinase-like uncharacterized protein yjeF
MADRWTSADAGRTLRMPTDDDDKYSRGVLGVRTGSDAYPGAAVLGVEAAWRAGVGMVRYVGPRHPSSLVLQRRPETVTAAGRVQAWLIGSGTDARERTDAETAALREILAGAVPVVIDAGALDLAPDARAARVVTPHAREHARLRQVLGLDPVDAVDDAARAAAAHETAVALDAVVLLKGAVTVVAAPDGWIALVESGTPWLATAGTGDVLGGVLGALVAGAAPGADLGPLVATGAWLHGRAGTLAALRVGAGADGSGPITALDVAEHVPFAVGEALAAG